MATARGDSKMKPIAELLETLGIKGGTEERKMPKKRLPILIFPGFMSSALQAKEVPGNDDLEASDSGRKAGSSSSQRRSSTWEGKRIWLDVKQAGFSSMYFGGALESNEGKRERGEDYDEALHREHLQELQCKSRWVAHLKLSDDDLRSDLPNIRVRAMTGLDAINYLDPGGLVKRTTWVFHHVSKVLLAVGYTEGHDLDVATYDWRIPPSDLEDRDGYFSSTVQQIERLYSQNDNTPVVLLCHSMGCKTCHYLLNFALAAKGQEWLHKHIHTYFPVGAPHCGAPKSLRSTVIGDRMGLEAFLSEEEALLCGRSFGSTPWMFPYRLPPHSPHIAYLKRDGALHITVQPINCEEMLQNRNNKPSKLRLDVTYRGEVLRSRYHSLEGFTVTFPETFTFAASQELPLEDKDDVLRISLYESGFNLKQKVGKKGCCPRWFPRCWKAFWGLTQSIVDTLIPIQCWRQCWCIANHDTITGAVATAAVVTANVTTGLLGAATLLADSEEKKLSDVSLQEGEVTECLLQLRFGDWRKIRKDLLSGDQRRMDVVTGETSSIPVQLNVQWKPPAHDVDPSQLSDVRVGIPSEDATDLHVYEPRVKEAAYEAVNGVQLLLSEYMPRYRKLLEEVYDADPLLPRTMSSESAPPVKRVKAVYGIDLPTEISAVYRRRNIVQREGQLVSLHELDPRARIESNDFQIQAGLVLETSRTPQPIFGSDDEVVHRSGDGTVPYYSLQQCRRWKDKCQVEIDELPQAEHREILGDERFLKILLDYVTEY